MAFHTHHMMINHILEKFMAHTKMVIRNWKASTEAALELGNGPGGMKMAVWIEQAVIKKG